MRKLLVPAVLVVSMAAGSAAFAATTAKPAAPSAKPAASSTKSADCMKQWSAQKTHTQTKKAFLAACEKA